MTDGVRLKRALGFWDLVAFGLICIAPVAPFTLFGFVYSFSEGVVVIPYVLGAIGLGFTGLSYASMAEIEPQAGSVYGFAKLALGSFFGFIGGWSIMLDYIVVGALVLLYAAIYMNSLLPVAPVPLLIGLFTVMTLTLNLAGIRLAAWVELLVAGLQIVVGLMFVAAAATLLGSGTFGPQPLWPSGATLQGVMAATPIAVIAFLGFDAISTLSEEVRGKNPGTLVAQATVASLALMLILFVMITWLLASLAPGLQMADPATAGIDVVAARVPWLATALSVAVAVAYGVGLTPAVQTGVSRLAFAMARGGDLPGFLARLHPVRQVPAKASIVFGTLLALIAWLALPYVDVLGGVVSFGAIVGFILVNASVLVHLGVRRRSRRWFRHWLSPLMGIGVLVWVLTGVLPQAFALGVAWLVVGVAWYVARHRLKLRPQNI